jgi:hypothetical protein
LVEIKQRPPELIGLISSCFKKTPDVLLLFAPTSLLLFLPNPYSLVENNLEIMIPTYLSPPFARNFIVAGVERLTIAPLPFLPSFPCCLVTNN